MRWRHCGPATSLIAARARTVYGRRRIPCPELHYATSSFVGRGADDQKDQSYVLGYLTEEQLAVLVLPIGAMHKSEVRREAERLGLRTWDKPAAACLASRLPYGTPVTVRTLRSVAEAESGLRALGLAQLRVRHHGDVARIEVPPEDFDTVLARRDDVVSAVHAAGYAYVALDLEGFVSGSLNRVLATSGGTQAPADRGLRGDR